MYDLSVGARAEFWSEQTVVASKEEGRFTMYKQTGERERERVMGRDLGIWNLKR